MNFRRGKQEEPLEINLVPLIDVMMVILIFLMITTTYSKYTELQINLPTADSDKQLERPNEVPVVVVTAKELTQAEREMLAGRTRQILAKGSATAVELTEAVAAAVRRRPAKEPALATA